MKLKSNKSLATLGKHEVGYVTKFTDDTLASRLIAMGILPGSQARLLCKAPLRGGFYIKFDNQRVALRSVEAQSIVVSV